mmetsp:Transcript_8085/g.10233  ORF Transcript_8085/g.10233 Transcript_8085/m.10233 type:complete len:150 (+) Transcript_8085:208-657(+)
MSFDLSASVIFISTTIFGLCLIRTRRKSRLCGASQQVFALDMQLEREENNDKLKRIIYTEPNTGRYAMHLIFGPNVTYPPHLHVSAEWCFLTKGILVDNYGEKVAPCFFYNEKGSLHYDISSGPDGCEILVVKDKGTNAPLSNVEKCCF